MGSHIWYMGEYSIASGQTETSVRRLLLDVLQ